MNKTKLLYTLCCAVILGTIGAFAEARYVFYFIGDGMGMGHVNAAETYRRDVLKSDSPLLMLTFPAGGQARTYSASSPITDSAAAGTALASGHKTTNYMVGVTPNTVDVQSIAQDFMRDGRAVGIVTSVAGDDATPAAFYAHAANRSMKEKISGYAPASDVNYFAAPVFKGMKNADGTPSDWLQKMKDAGYQVFHNEMEYHLSSRITPLNLMIAERPVGEQLGYTLDVNDNKSLTLKEMVSAGIQILQSDPQGFFMMAEGGNIDWAAHANDGATVIREILEFQNAINEAYKFYLAHPDETLIVVTADHDTGGMALGRKDNPKHPDLALIGFQKISKDRFADWCRDNWKDKTPSWEEMRAFLSENLGLWQSIQPTPEEDKDIRDSFEATFVTHRATDEKTLYNDFNNFTVTLYDILNRHYGIGWTTPSHTGNFVPVYAIGEGSSLFGKNLDNTEIPGLILRAAGLQR